MRWIGHAGLAVDRPGGAPTAADLGGALGLGLDRLEVDVAATGGGDLVLVHDEHVGGMPVAAMSLPALRARLPGVLTLDEGLEVTGALPLLLDLKGAAVALPLGRLLHRRHDPARLAVCTDDLAALLTLRHTAPQVARWRTLPAVGSGHGERRRRAIAVLRRHALPARLPMLAREVAAEAVCVDHYVVTGPLCDSAHTAGLVVAAWTVNRAATLRRVAAAGVDLVTTDRPQTMRALLTAA